VEANAPRLRRAAPASVEVVQTQRIVDLPLNGRNVTDLITLTGAAVSFGNLPGYQFPPDFDRRPSLQRRAVRNGLLPGWRRNHINFMVGLPLPLRGLSGLPCRSSSRIQRSSRLARGVGCRHRGDPVGIQQFPRQSVRIYPQPVHSAAHASTFHPPAPFPISATSTAQRLAGRSRKTSCSSSAAFRIRQSGKNPDNFDHQRSDHGHAERRLDGVRLGAVPKRASPRL